MDATPMKSSGTQRLPKLDVGRVSGCIATDYGDHITLYAKDTYSGGQSELGFRGALQLRDWLTAWLDRADD